MPSSTPPLRLARRLVGARGVAALSASVLAHGALSIAMFHAPGTPSVPEPEIGTNELVDLSIESAPPPAPETEMRPPSPEPSGVETPTESPRGLRVHRGRPTPGLRLARIDARSGPFGLRDRLDLGDLTPRVVPTFPVVRRAPTPTPPSEAPSEEPVAAAETASVEPADTEPPSAEPPSAEPPSAEPEAPPPEAPPETTPGVRLPHEVTALSLRDPSPGAGAARSAVRIAGVDLVAYLGLDAESLRRVVRVHGEPHDAFGFATELGVSELRARAEGAANERGIPIRFEGDAERAIAHVTLGSLSAAIAVAQDSNRLVVVSAADEARIEAILAALEAPEETLTHVVIRIDPREGRRFAGIDASLLEDGAERRLLLRLSFDAPPDATIEPDPAELRDALATMGLEQQPLELRDPPRLEDGARVYELDAGRAELGSLLRRLGAR